MSDPAACPKCRAAIAPGEAFCSACGFTLRADAAERRRVGERIGLKYAKQSYQGSIKSGRSTIMVCGILVLLGTVLIYFVGGAALEKADGEIRGARGNPMYDQEKVEQAARDLSKARGLVHLIIGGNAVVAVAFLALWAWAKSRPLPATLSALILFLAMQGLNLVLEPGQFMNPVGLLIRVLIVVALARAVTAAQKYQKMQQAL